MKYQLILNLPKYNMIVFLTIIHFLQYFAISISLQNALQSNYLQKLNIYLNYNSLIIIKDQYFKKIFFTYMGIMLLFSILVFTAGKSNSEKFIKAVSILYLIFKNTKNIIFQPYLQLSFELSSSWRFFTLIIIYGMQMYCDFMQIQAYNYSKFIYHVNKTKQQYIQSIIDVSVLLSSFQDSIYFSLLNSGITSSIIFLIHQMENQIYGNFFIDLFLQCQSLFYFIFSFVVSIYILFNFKCHYFITIIVLTQVIAFILLLFTKLYMRHKNIQITCQNLHIIENISYTLKNDLNEQNQYIYKYNYQSYFELQKKQYKKNQKNEDECFNQKQLTEKMISKLKQQSNDTFSPVYYEILANYLISEKKATGTKIDYTQYIEIDEKKFTIQNDQNMIYKQDEILQFLLQTKINCNSLLDTIQYLDGIIQKLNVNDINYVLKLLNMQAILKFNDQLLNKVEKQLVMRLITYQLRIKIISIVELLCMLNKLKYNKFYITYLMRLFIQDPQLLILNADMQQIDYHFDNLQKPYTNYSEGIDQLLNKQNLKIKKIHENVEMIIQDKEMEQQQNILLLGKEQCNQLLDQLSYINEVYNSVILQKVFDKLIIKSSVYLYEQHAFYGQLKSQQFQIIQLQKCRKRYELIEQLFYPLYQNKQIQNYYVVEKILQLITKNLSNIINQINYFQDSIQLFFSIKTKNQLYQNIDDQIQQSILIINKYEQANLHQINSLERNVNQQLLDYTQFLLNKHAMEKEKDNLNQQFSYYNENNNYFVLIQKLLVFFDQLEVEIFSDLESYYNDMSKYSQIQKVVNQQYNEILVQKCKLMIQRSVQITPILIQLQEVFLRCNQITNKYYLQFQQKFKNNINFQEHSLNIQENIQGFKIKSLNYDTFQCTITKHNGSKLLELLDQFSIQLFQYQFCIYINLQSAQNTHNHNKIFVNLNYDKCYKQLYQIKKIFNKILSISFQQFNENNNNESQQTIIDILSLFYFQPYQQPITEINEKVFENQDYKQALIIYNVLYFSDKLVLKTLLKYNNLLPQQYYNYFTKINQNSQDNIFQPAQFQQYKDDLILQATKGRNVQCLQYIQNNQEPNVVYEKFLFQSQNKISDQVIYNKYQFDDVKTHPSKTKQWHTTKQIQQLFPKNKLRYFFKGPNSMYEHNIIQNFRQFKHFNEDQNDHLQNTMRVMNKLLCKQILFSIIMLFTLGYMYNITNSSISMIINVKKMSVNFNENLVQLAPTIKQYQVAYNQFDKGQNTLPFELFDDSKITNNEYYYKLINQYKLLLDSFANKIFNCINNSTQMHSYIVQVLQFVIQNIINSYSKFMQIFELKLTHSIQYVPNTQYVNPLITISNKKYSISKASQFIQQQNNIKINNTQSQVFNSADTPYKNSYFFEQLIVYSYNLFKMLFINNDIGQDNAFCIQCFGQQENFQSHLNQLHIQKIEEPMLQVTADYIYKGNTSNTKYLSYQYHSYNIDNNQLLKYFDSTFNFNEQQNYFYYKWDVIYGQMIVMFVVLILFTIIFAILVHKGKQRSQKFFNKIEQHIQDNYIDYFPNDMISSEVYKNLAIKRQFTNYLNNLNNKKVTIIQSKQQDIKYIIKNKNKQYFQTTQYKYCKSQYHERILNENLPRFLQIIFLFFLLGFVFNFSTNSFKQVNNKQQLLDIDNQQILNAYQQSIVQYQGLTIKFQLFGRFQDLKLLKQTSINIKKQQKILFDSMIGNQYKILLNISDNVINASNYNIIYSYQVNCNNLANFPLPRDYKMLKENQKSLPAKILDDHIQTICQSDTQLIIDLLKSFILDFDYQKNLSLDEIQIQHNQRLLQYIQQDPTHEEELFEKFYSELNLVSDIQKYQLLSNELKTMNFYVTQLMTFINEYQRNIQVQCEFKQNQHHEIFTQKLFVIILVLSIHLIFITYTSNFKISFKYKPFSILFCSDIVVAILIIVFSYLQINNQQCISQKDNISQNTSKLLKSFTKRMISYTSQNNLQDIIKQYLQIQKTFAKFDYQSEFSMNDVLNSETADILSQISLTNKAFYQMSTFANKPMDQLYIGDYSSENQFMEYEILLGHLLQFLQQQKVQLSQDHQNKIVYPSLICILLIYVQILTCIIIFKFQQTNTKKLKIKQCDVIVKPYIVIFLKQIILNNEIHYKFEYKEKYTINSTFYNKSKFNKSQCQRFSNFDEIKDEVDLLLDKIQDFEYTFSDLIQNPPDFVAFCISRSENNEQISMLQPATVRVGVVSQCCPDCLCEEAKKLILSKRNYKYQSKALKSSENGTFSIISALVVLIYLLGGFSTLIAIIIKSKSYICKLAKQNEITKSVYNLNNLYDDYKLLCQKGQNSQQLSYQALDAFQEHQQLLTTSQDILVDQPYINEQVLVIEQYKQSLNKCKNLKDSIYLADLVAQKTDKLLLEYGKNDYLIWYFNFPVIAVIILLLFIFKQITLFALENEYKWLDNMYGFLVRGRDGLKNFLVR